MINVLCGLLISMSAQNRGTWRESTAWPTRNDICLQNDTWEMLYHCSDEADLNLCIPEMKSNWEPRRQALARRHINGAPGTRSLKYLFTVHFTIYPLNSPLWRNSHQTILTSEQTRTNIPKPKEPNDIPGKFHLYTEHQFWWLCQYIKKHKTKKQLVYPRLGMKWKASIIAPKNRKRRKNIINGKKYTGRLKIWVLISTLLLYCALTVLLIKREFYYN